MAETRLPQYYGFILTFFTLATVGISLRLYSRLTFSKIGLDDILMFMAYIFMIAKTAILLVGAQVGGIGRKMGEISLEEAQISLKVVYASHIIYPIQLGLIKTSIVLLLVRILPASHSARQPLRYFAVAIAVTEIALTFALIFQCTPIEMFWLKPRGTDRTCVNQLALYYSDASLNLLIDLIVLACPVVLFRKIPVPERKKWSVIALFSAGVFTLVASTLRIPYLHDINITNKRWTWHVVDILSWSMAEVGSSMFLACLPPSKPLYNHLMTRFGLRKVEMLTETSDIALSAGGHNAFARRRQRRGSSIASTDSSKGSVYSVQSGPCDRVSNMAYSGGCCQGEEVKLAYEPKAAPYRSSQKP